jgi:uncharacterized membrane protein
MLGMQQIQVISNVTLVSFTLAFPFIMMCSSVFYYNCAFSSYEYVTCKSNFFMEHEGLPLLIILIIKRVIYKTEQKRKKAKKDFNQTLISSLCLSLL